MKIMLIFYVLASRLVVSLTTKTKKNGILLANALLGAEELFNKLSFEQVTFAFDLSTSNDGIQEQ